MNGGSARLVSPGDIITLLAFEVTGEIKPPKKILVDENNKFVQYA